MISSSAEEDRMHLLKYCRIYVQSSYLYHSCFLRYLASSGRIWSNQEWKLPLYYFFIFLPLKSLSSAILRLRHCLILIPSYPTIISISWWWYLFHNAQAILVIFFVNFIDLTCFASPYSLSWFNFFLLLILLIDQFSTAYQTVTCHLKPPKIFSDCKIFLFLEVIMIIIQGLLINP